MNKISKIILFVIIIIILIFLVSYSASQEITNFEECVSAGNPIMESYPRQCRDASNDRTFVEEI